MQVAAVLRVELLDLTAHFAEILLHGEDVVDLAAFVHQLAQVGLRAAQVAQPRFLVDDRGVDVFGVDRARLDGAEQAEMIERVVEPVRRNFHDHRRGVHGAGVVRVRVVERRHVAARTMHRGLRELERRFDVAHQQVELRFLREPVLLGDGPFGRRVCLALRDGFVRGKRNRGAARMNRAVVLWSRRNTENGRPLSVGDDVDAPRNVRRDVRFARLVRGEGGGAEADDERRGRGVTGRRSPPGRAQPRRGDRRRRRRDPREHVVEHVLRERRRRIGARFER